MGKWLAAGGVVLAALILLLWLQMRPDDPAPSAHPVATAPSAAPAATAPVAAAAAPKPAAAAESAEPAPEPEVPPGKLDPRSDEFFYKFDEVVPQRLARNAAKCYEGRHGSLHRNQKLSLRFKTRIRDGEVTVRDVTIKESTLNDDALQNCFIQQVARSTWKDAELPDWDQDDEVVLRPERGMKKFWQDNIDYVGAVAPPQ